MNKENGLTLTAVGWNEYGLKVLTHRVAAIDVIMRFMVVDYKRRQGICKLIFELQSKVLNEIIKAPFMCALVKLNVVAIAKCWSYAAKDCERFSLVLSRRYWDCEILVFRIPGSLLNQLRVESGSALKVNIKSLTRHSRESACCRYS